MRKIVKIAPWRNNDITKIIKNLLFANDRERRQIIPMKICFSWVKFGYACVFPHDQKQNLALIAVA